MRVIAGTYRSRKLCAGRDRKVRPTSDKVKGALFNMLEPLRGSRVLDLYAGTGNLGIEALSRGAADVVFVENHPAALGLIRANLTGVGIPAEGGAVRLIGRDVLRACWDLSKEGKSFDLVLADPPYGEGAFPLVQRILMQYPLLSPGGILAVEHSARDAGLEPGLPWELARQRTYGDTCLTLFRNG